MIKNFLFILLIAFAACSNAQDTHHKWSHNVIEKGQVITIEYICDIDSGWHIYPLDVVDDLGLPTSMTISENEGFEVVGPVVEPTPHSEYDDVFEMDLSYHDGRVIFTQEVSNKTGENLTLLVDIKSMACMEGMCTPPVTQTLNITIPAGGTDSDGLIWVFWAGLGAGLLALLTPCVFPMIPMTVTLFTKQSESRVGGVMKAFVYGVSIVVIYVTLGLGITLVFGGEALGQMASSGVFNIAFFIILVFFAVSFMGAFEITIPNAFVNKIDAKADKEGWLGIFFMAFALALVSFSCTGPIVSTLLLQASLNGDVIGPFIGMLGFGIGLAFPFTLFAVFPDLLNKLPKSGGWLNSVKVVLGLLELALALKFLSNADLVYQTHILTREVFIALWIAIAAVMVLYLIGKIKFSHDSDLTFLSVPRSMFAMFFVGVIVYMIPGMFGAPLKLLSAVLPPTSYNEGWVIGNNDTASISEESTHDDVCPNGLTCYHDYDEGMKVAQTEGKPVMLDFTGRSCTNCRVVEQVVWSSPAIDKLIREEFILISLYVDSREELPESERYVSVRSGKEIDEYGKKWRDFEISRFNQISLPLYVLLDHEGKELTEKLNYTKDIQEYKAFLEKGLAEFKRRR
jgi:thiol:disulfide interchange protein